MPAPANPPQLTLYIICLHPPTTGNGLAFGLQDKTPALHAGTPMADGSLVFECRVGVKPGPDFAGSFVQGPRGGRFLYLSLGTRTGDAWQWQRRLKIPLSGITDELLTQAGANGILQATVDGRGAATVKLIGRWTVES